MSAISAGNQTLLRSTLGSHKTTERLYALGEITVWSGRVNEADPTRGQQVIAYDGGAMASGFSFANITGGIMVLFGSSAGADDVGRRVMLDIDGDATSGTITVDWHSNMQITDNDHITIIHFWPPWPAYSWFTISGPNFTKNGPPSPAGAGLDYTDQNEEPWPVVIMGYHYANELPAAGTIDINEDASNSYAIADGASIASWAWTVTGPAGASFDDDTSATPVLTLASEGTWWVHCTITDTNGKTYTGHRVRKIGGGIKEFNRGELSPRFNEPILNCRISSTSPDTSDSTAIRPEIDWSDFSRGTLVIIAADDTYGSTAGTISSKDDFPDHQRIIWTGYIQRRKDRLTLDQQGRPEKVVELETVNLISMYLYSLSLTGKRNPTDWYEMSPELMTLRGNLAHLFTFHSYLMGLADFRFPSDTVRRSANEEFTEGNLIERARAFCRARLVGMTATPQGEIVFEQDLNITSAATIIAATTTLTLANADVNAFDPNERDIADAIRVTVSGGISQGELGSYQPVLAGSAAINNAQGQPVTIPVDRLMFASSTEARRFAARIAQQVTYDVDEIVIELTGNYREVFNPAYQQLVNLGTVPAYNLQGNTILTNADVIVRQVRHSHSNESRTTTVSLICEPVYPEGLDGVDLPTPAVPSDDFDDDGYEGPPAPYWPPLPPDTIDNYSSTGTLYVGDNTNGVYYRKPGDLDWTSRNAGLTGNDLYTNQLGFDPWWQQPEKQNSYNIEMSILFYLSGDEDSPSKIWRSTDGGATWQDVTPLTDPPNTWGDMTAPTVADVRFVARADNIHQNGHHYVLAEWHNGADWRMWMLKTEDDGATWEWIGGETGDVLTGYEYPSSYTYVDLSTPGTVVVTGEANLTTEDQMCCMTSGWTGANQVTITMFYASTFELDQIALDVYLKNYSSRDANGGSGFGASIRAGDGSTSILLDEKWAQNGIHSWSEREQQVVVAAGADGYIFDRLILGGAYWPFSVSSATACLSGIGVRKGDGASSVVETRPIWFDIDTQDGNVCWMTVWKGTGGGPGELFLQRRSTTDFSLSAEWSLGSATETEVFPVDPADRIYIAYPYTPAFDQDACYVYGRMNGPAGVVGTQHIIRTVDGGTNFTSVESSFSADYVGALQAWDDGGNWHLAFVRNISGGNGTFYKGTTPTAQGSTPFQVNVDGLSQYSGAFAIGAIAAVGGQMVAESTDNGVTWNDLTDSLPVNGSIKSAVYV